jgi:hypothetical protein
VDADETLVASRRAEGTAKYRSPFVRPEPEAAGADPATLVQTAVVLIWNPVRREGSTLGRLRRMVEGRQRTVLHAPPPLPQRARRVEYTRWSQVLPARKRNAPA